MTLSNERLALWLIHSYGARAALSDLDESVQARSKVTQTSNKRMCQIYLGYFARCNIS
jgi:hypothetical protein